MLIEHSICPSCSVGCGLNLINEDDKILGIYPYKRHPINEGKNCLKGKESYKIVDKNRISNPLLKKQNKLVDSNWEESLEKIGEILKKYSSEDIGILTSGKVSSEYIESINNFGKTQGINNIGFFNNNFPNFDEEIANYDEINNADSILIIGDVLKNNPLIGRRILIAKDNGAKILSVDISDITTTSLNSDEYTKISSISEFLDENIEEIKTKLDENSVIIFNKVDSKEDFDKIVKIGKEINLKILPVLKDCNSYGAMKKIPALNKKELINLINNSKVLFIFGEDIYSILKEEDLKQINLSQIDSLITITSNLNETSEIADIILPSYCWAEQSGTFTNTSGMAQKFEKAKKSQDDILSVEEIIKKIYDSLENS